MKDEILDLSVLEKRKHIKTDRVPVTIISDSNQEWLIPTAGTGPILITVDSEGKDTSIYWKIPQDMAYDQASDILSDTLWDVLSQYDNIISVENTFNE